MVNIQVQQNLLHKYVDEHFFYFIKKFLYKFEIYTCSWNSRIENFI